MSRKSKILCIVASIMVLALFLTNSYAATLLTEDEALKEMFPDVDEVVRENVTLTAAEVDIIQERLGGSLVHYQDGSKSEEVMENKEITFFIGKKNGETVRMAIIDIQPGKWGPVDFIVAIDTKTNKVNNLAVMAYVEKRGRPIARRNFLKQFIGKDSSNSISVRSGKGVSIDIRAISGATISSDATCFSVKKVLAIYEEVFQKKFLAMK